MASVLGTLQIQVDKLSKDNTRLRDNLAKFKEENYQLRRRLKKKDQEIDNKINNAVTKALNKFESSEIKRLEKENKKLEKKIIALEKELSIKKSKTN